RRRGHGGLSEAVGPGSGAVTVSRRAWAPAYHRAPGAGCDRERTGAGLEHGDTRGGRKHHRASLAPFVSRARACLAASVSAGDQARACPASTRVRSECDAGSGVRRVSLSAADAAGVEQALGWVTAGRTALETQRRAEHRYWDCDVRGLDPNFWAWHPPGRTPSPEPLSDPSIRVRSAAGSSPSRLSVPQ